MSDLAVTLKIDDDYYSYYTQLSIFVFHIFKHESHP